LTKALHIVAFNVPFPPNYGGVIDIFYKVQHLATLGVGVHLHCFQYGRSHAAELEAICLSVTYYTRRLNPLRLFSNIPFIVTTRQNTNLLRNLSADSLPILFEGVHTCYYLSHTALKYNKKLVRMHNIEHQYYEYLAIHEQNPLKKQYFRHEAAKLQHYQPLLGAADTLLGISPADTAYLKQQYPNIPVHWLPPFHAFNSIHTQLGKGNYILYHGNLAVSENENAAYYILHQIAPLIPTVPIIIAGSNPSQQLAQAIQNTPHTTLHANLTDTQLQLLIQQAHINILPTFQPTGIKLKLLTALYNGRFCIANNDMLAHTHLQSTCIIANTPQQFAQQIHTCLHKEFDLADLTTRQNALTPYTNATNAQFLAQLL
jgi:hypothetical protein